VNAYGVLVDVDAALLYVGGAYVEIAQGLADRLLEALTHFQALGFESAQIDWRFAASLLPFSSFNASIRRFRRGRRSPQPAQGQPLGPVDFYPVRTAPAVMASRPPRLPGDEPIVGVARASNGRVLFFLDRDPNTVPVLRDGATGRSPLVAHEFFHLVQQGYAPTLSSSLALPEEPLQRLVPSYLRWFSEGTATAAGVSKYVYDLGDGTGYDPRLVTAALKLIHPPA
jgi:hypothetical protein